ncbi:hypothetical protein [Paenibacillus sp. IITD108]|uniref:hypothetical protein n=1 Tax=Paenibacillus sp. IITD108 TaxID=3116649 RepID=UPI002F40C5AD
MAKTDWTIHDVVKPEDLNQLSQDVNEAGSQLDAHIGSRGNAHLTATRTEAGFMSAADKQELDKLAEEMGNMGNVPTQAKTVSGAISELHAAGKSNESLLQNATSASTANTLVKRDASGRFKAAAPVAADDVARKAEIDAPPFTTTTGTSVAYVASFSPAYSALVAGTRITVKFHVANTGAATINVNGLGAKSILRASGAALTAGIIKMNAVMSLVYDGTNFILQGEGGNGNATAADLLIGKTASVDAGDIVGTMPNRSGHVTGQSISRSGTTLRIRPQPGYVPGDASNSVQWDDVDWIAENIRAGVDIFGVIGTLEEGAKVASGTVNFPAKVAAVIDIRGLDFRPKLIVVYNETQGYFYSAFPVSAGGTYRTIIYNAGNYSVSSTGPTFYNDGFSATTYVGVNNANNLATVARWIAFDASYY